MLEEIVKVIETDCLCHDDLYNYASNDNLRVSTFRFVEPNTNLDSHVALCK